MMKTANALLSGLYAIADTELLTDNLISSVNACLRGGARLIQFRDKSSNSDQRKQAALALLEACKPFNAQLIINDDVELAFEIGAAGVHLGKHDTSLQEARTKLGKGSLIGISCYNQLKLAKDAKDAGADYVAFGSIFPSPTKPNAVHAGLELISTAKKEFDIPVCAIGGINLMNAYKVVDAGANMLAVISGLFKQADIENTARQLINIIEPLG